MNDDRTKAPLEELVETLQEINDSPMGDVANADAMMAFANSLPQVRMLSLLHACLAGQSALQKVANTLDAQVKEKMLGLPEELRIATPKQTYQVVQKKGTIFLQIRIPVESTLLSLQQYEEKTRAILASTEEAKDDPIDQSTKEREQ